MEVSGPAAWAAERVAAWQQGVCVWWGGAGRGQGSAGAKTGRPGGAASCSRGPLHCSCRSTKSPSITAGTLSHARMHAPL